MEEEYRKLPSSIELTSLADQQQTQQTQTNAVKRPPSYSDSFFILKKNTTINQSSFEFLDLATVQEPPASPKPPTNTAKITNQTQTHTHTPKTHEHAITAIGFLFHITLISLFESLFFYYFISRSEDKGILTTVNNLLAEVTRTCPSWPANQTVILRDLFTLLINQTALQAAAQQASATRAAYNNHIFLQSWMYVVALASSSILVFAIATWRHYLTKAAMRRILLENLGLVALLGVYEFAFFKTIIYNYDSISVLEIEEYAVNTLQSQCFLTYRV